MQKKKKKILIVLFMLNIILLLSFVSAQTPTGGMEINTLPDDEINYGVQSVVQALENNLNDFGCVYKLHRNNGPVTNPDIQILEPGVYVYVYNTTGCLNYTAGEITKNLVVYKSKESLKLFLNNLENDISISGGHGVNIKAQFEDFNANISVYVDDKIIYEGMSPSENYLIFNESGRHKVSAYYKGDEYNEPVNKILYVFVDVPDSKGPEITLISPKDSENVTYSIFSYYVKDESAIEKCTLIVNNRELYNSTTVIRNSKNYFNISFLSPGTYSWAVSCTDEIGNKATSPTKRFSMIGVVYAQEGGEYIGGSLADIFLVYPGENNQTCTERWLCTPWSVCLNELRTRSCVDLSYCGTEKNKPPIEIPCDFVKPDIRFSPSSSNFTVRIRELTNFIITVNENYQKNGTIIIQWFLNSELVKQSFGAGNLDSSIDIELLNSSIVSAKILGDYYSEILLWNVEAVETECIEKWKCGWTFCKSDGYRYTYDCIDSNSCGTVTNKPYREKCDCISEWRCYNWSRCLVKYELKDILMAEPLVNGKQRRLCKDLEKCTSNKIEEATCKIHIPVEIKEKTWCGENYVEVYSEGRLVSRIKKRTVYGLPALYIAFTISDFKGYCDYCYDGIQNNDEENVDCGGPCSPCEEAIGKVKRIGLSFLEVLNVLFLVFLISVMIYIVYMRTISLWVIFDRYKKRNF